MKSYISLALLLIFLTSCTNFLQKHTEQYGYLQNKKIAILPFEVVTGVKRLPAEVTLEMLKNEEKKYGYVMQRDVYRYLLRQLAKSESRVSFQEINETNSILEKNGVQFEDLKKMSLKKIARILKVDGILSGNVVQRRRSWNPKNSVYGGMTGRNNSVKATITIHDQLTGRMLWKYNNGRFKSLSGPTSEIAKELLRDAAQNFPFEAKK